MKYLKDDNQKKKPLREEIVYCILVVNAVVTCYLALSHKLSPLWMFFLCGAHFITLSVARFNETNPSPFLHFHRSVEGVILASTPLSTISYFFTWFLEGFSESAVFRSEICAAYTYFMLIWVIFAGLSVVGIYFAVSAFTFWSPLFLAQFPGFEPPFIIYPEVFIIFLMGLGTWFTHSMFLVGALSGKEDYGDDTRAYYNNAKLYLIGYFIFGIFLIIYETTIADRIISLLLQF